MKNPSIRIGLSISMVRTAAEGTAEEEGGGEGAAEPSHPSVLDCVDAARAIREEIAKKLTADKKTKELVVDGIPHVPESLGAYTHKTRQRDRRVKILHRTSAGLACMLSVCREGCCSDPCSDRHRGGGQRRVYCHQHRRQRVERTARRGRAGGVSHI